MGQTKLQTKLGVESKVYGCPWCPNFHTFSQKKSRDHMFIGKVPGCPISRRDHKRAIYMLDLMKSRVENKKYYGKKQAFQKKEKK